MSADIINLRRARKQKARVDRMREAEVNRQRFGRSKLVRQQGDALKALDEKALDGKLREPAQVRATPEDRD